MAQAPDLLKAAASHRVFECCRDRVSPTVVVPAAVEPETELVGLSVADLNIGYILLVGFGNFDDQGFSGAPLMHRSTAGSGGKRRIRG